MKKYIAIALLAFSTSAMAQTELTTDSVDLSMQMEPEVVALDTMPTKDKYIKIVLFSDHTWTMLDLGRPQVDEEDFEDNWENSKIHAYKGIVTVEDLPDEVEINLVDSIHGFVNPKTGPVRSGFKFRRVREHKGTDIGLKTGDPIYAAFDGKVRVVMTTRNTGGYGNLVIIRHPNGLETYYGHLSKHNVQENDIVKAGEIIGLGGSTGRSTGPHLHFEARYMGQPFDPERIIDFERGVLRDSTFILKKHYFSIYSHYGQTDQESIAASQRIIHTVRSKEVLGTIARKYGTTVARICKLNGFSAKKVIRPGQRIIVR